MKVSQDQFGKRPDGEVVEVYTVENDNGYSFRTMTHGATLISFKAPDRTGKIDEVTLGYDTLDGYFPKHPYFGATVGRVCNRIGGASFPLDGAPIDLPANEGSNMLHGGVEGFHAQIWAAEAFEREGVAGVTYSLHSPDGEMGFPGNLQVTVTQSLNSENELILDYQAETDAPTPVNLTNHAYWNLSGAPDLRRARGEDIPADLGEGGAVGDLVLTIFGDAYLQLDAAQIPTGRFIPVAGSPLDFTVAKPVGRDIGATENGYDFAYVLRGETGEMRIVAILESPSTGRRMEISSTLPSVQFYTGNKLPGALARTGESLKHDALCLETQFHPDAMNHDEFPPIVLRPGEVFKHTTAHKFSTS